MTGLGIPPHNFSAVNIVKWNPLALLSCVTHTHSCLFFFFFFFLVVDVFKQIIHSTRENTLGYSIRVSQVLFGVCPGETQTSQDWRWAMSSVYPLVHLNQDFVGVAYILSALVGHCLFSLPFRALCCTCCPILESYSAWRECSASSTSSSSADQKDGKNNKLHRVAAFSVQYLVIHKYKIMIDQTDWCNVQGIKKIHSE